MSSCNVGIATYRPVPLKSVSASRIETKQYPNPSLVRINSDTGTNAAERKRLLLSYLDMVKLGAVLKHDFSRYLLGNTVEIERDNLP